MARGGYRVNNGFSQNARKTTDDMTKRNKRNDTKYKKQKKRSYYNGKRNCYNRR